MWEGGEENVRRKRREEEGVEGWKIRMKEVERESE